MARPKTGDGQPQLISVRISDKQKFAIDLLCRIHREEKFSVSRAVLWALDTAFKTEVEGGLITQTKLKNGSDRLDMLEDLWSPDEAVRTVRLAAYRPDLLDDQEQRIMRRVFNDQRFWKNGKAPSQGPRGDDLIDQIDLDTLSGHWDEVK